MCYILGYFSHKSLTKVSCCTIAALVLSFSFLQTMKLQKQEDQCVMCSAVCSVFKTHQVSNSKQRQVCRNFKNELTCDCRTRRLYFVSNIITCTAAGFPAEQKSCRSAEGHSVKSSLVTGLPYPLCRCRGWPQQQQTPSEPGEKVVPTVSINLTPGCRVTSFKMLQNLTTV